MNLFRRLWLFVLPQRLFYASHLTFSAKRMLARICVGSTGLLMGLIGAGMLDTTNWTDVLSGALLAWSVSIIIWAVSSYNGEREIVTYGLRCEAERDLLHHRLNQIAERVGANQVDIDSELGRLLEERRERIAHFAGLDEFR